MEETRSNIEDRILLFALSTIRTSLHSSAQENGQNIVYCLARLGGEPIDRCDK